MIWDITLLIIIMIISYPWDVDLFNDIFLAIFLALYQKCFPETPLPDVSNNNKLIHTVAQVILKLANKSQELPGMRFQGEEPRRLAKFCQWRGLSCALCWLLACRMRCCWQPARIPVRSLSLLIFSSELSSSELISICVTRLNRNSEWTAVAGRVRSRSGSRPNSKDTRGFS